MRKGMDHTAASATLAPSVTLQIWLNGAKEKYCNFATFNRIVDTKTQRAQLSSFFFENCVEFQEFYFTRL